MAHRSSASGGYLICSHRAHLKQGSWADITLQAAYPLRRGKTRYIVKATPPSITTTAHRIHQELYPELLDLMLEKFITIAPKLAAIKSRDPGYSAAQQTPKPAPTQQPMSTLTDAISGNVRQRPPPASQQAQQQQHTPMEVASALEGNKRPPSEDVLPESKQAKISTPLPHDHGTITAILRAFPKSRLLSIAGDGNCFFHALRSWHSSRTHMQLREKVAGLVLKRKLQENHFQLAENKTQIVCTGG
eukprot:6170203-Amphidinium_carterae.1